jgi:hypothetical protein
LLTDRVKSKIYQNETETQSNYAQLLNRKNFDRFFVVRLTIS